jgi:hypothetical protein
MKRIRRVVSIVVCVAAAAYAIPASYSATTGMRDSARNPVSERWAGGMVWSVDTVFLDWVRGQIPPGDRFLLIDGTGNIAIAEWAPFQLFPNVITKDASEADWVVLYGIYRGNAGPEVEGFSDERVYADGYSLLGREGVPTQTETDDDGS